VWSAAMGGQTHLWWIGERGSVLRADPQRIVARPGPRLRECNFAVPQGTRAGETLTLTLALALALGTESGSVSGSRLPTGR
jgi:hypothetical protein